MSFSLVLETTTTASRLAVVRCPRRCRSFAGQIRALATLQMQRASNAFKIGSAAFANPSRKYGTEHQKNRIKSCVKVNMDSAVNIVTINDTKLITNDSLRFSRSPSTATQLSFLTTFYSFHFKHLENNFAVHEHTTVDWRFDCTCCHRR
jgi:hypothetical protein